jgi:hypothetical protein
MTDDLLESSRRVREAAQGLRAAVAPRGGTRQALREIYGRTLEARVPAQLAGLIDRLDDNGRPS